MAEQRGNRWYPTYYDISNKKMLIDPNKSPSENIWWFIEVCVGIWLSKYRIYAFDKTAIEDLEQSARLTCYLRLRKHVRDGTYRRDLSFYLNVRGAAFGSVPDTIRGWKLRYVDIPNKLIAIDTPIDGPAVKSEELTLADTLASHKVTKLCLSTDKTIYYRVPHWTDLKRQCDKCAWIRRDMREQYDKYTEDCEELGIAPVSYETYIENSLTEEEKEIIHYKRSTRAEYQHQYWERRKQDPVWRAKQRASARERALAIYHRKKKEQGG